MYPADALTVDRIVQIQWYAFQFSYRQLAYLSLANDVMLIFLHITLAQIFIIDVRADKAPSFA